MTAPGQDVRVRASAVNWPSTLPSDCAMVSTATPGAGVTPLETPFKADLLGRAGREERDQEQAPW